jgi:hypothetical protein
LSIVWRIPPFPPPAPPLRPEALNEAPNGFVSLTPPEESIGCDDDDFFSLLLAGEPLLVFAPPPPLPLTTVPKSRGSRLAAAFSRSTLGFAFVAPLGLEALLFFAVSPAGFEKVRSSFFVSEALD